MNGMKGFSYQFSPLEFSYHLCPDLLLSVLRPFLGPWTLGLLQLSRIRSFAEVHIRHGLSQALWLVQGLTPKKSGGLEPHIHLIRTWKSGWLWLSCRVHGSLWFGFHLRRFWFFMFNGWKREYKHGIEGNKITQPGCALIPL